MRARAALSLCLAAALSGCGVPPPKSPIPTGQAAIDRMKASYACALGVQADAKLDHQGERGRLRGNVSLYAVRPAQVRIDVISSFNTTVATLASDGKDFAFNDVVNKQFVTGHATPCNIAKMTLLPVPGHALVSLLHGEAPVLVHDPAQPTVSWSRSGYYVVDIASTRDATQTLHLAPPRDDLDKPWQEQRLRVVEMVVKQRGETLYEAVLSGHSPADIGKPSVDDEGIDEPVPTIGPACSIDVPRTITVKVLSTGEKVGFRYEKVVSNPPVPKGVFVLPYPGGSQRVNAGDCNGLEWAG